MTNPTKVIDYILKNFQPMKKMKNMDIHSRELCSALAYQFLLLENNIEKSVEEILSDEPYIGLLGQKDEFELFHEVKFLQLHAILHDAYGRVYNKYGFGRGYTYAFNAPRFMRSNPFLGHITGFWFCLHHKLFC